MLKITFLHRLYTERVFLHKIYPEIRGENYSVVCNCGIIDIVCKFLDDV